MIPTSSRSEYVRFCHLRLDYFNVPAACVQADDFGRRQHTGVENIGQIAVPLAIIAIANRAHGVFSPVGRGSADPDNGIKEAIRG